MITAYIVTVFLLLVLSAFFSAAETAYSSITKSSLKAYGIIKKRNVKSAKKLLQDYDNLISAILIANNFVNVLIASVSTKLYLHFFGSDSLPIISAVVATLVILFIGEVTPKSLAKDHAEPFAVFAAPALQMTKLLFLPLSYLFSYWKRRLTVFFNLKQESKYSKEEMLMYVEDVREEGNINANEAALLKNAITFPEKQAQDIATPRVNVQAVSITCSKEEIAKAFLNTKFSRIVVYQDSIDKIIGTILMKNFYQGMNITDQRIEDIISPVIFISPTEKIGRVLKEMQSKQCQIAVVLDEFGGTYGILTIEDVLEELVGEIYDEHEQVFQPFREISEDIYQVDAKAELEDFCEFFHIKIDSEMNTLNGWVGEMLSDLPQIGDTFQYGKLTIKVLEVSNHTVSCLEIKMDRNYHEVNDLEENESNPES